MRVIWKYAKHRTWYGKPYYVIIHLHYFGKNLFPCGWGGHPFSDCRFTKNQAKTICSYMNLIEKG